MSRINQELMENSLLCLKPEAPPQSVADAYTYGIRRDELDNLRRNIEMYASRTADPVHSLRALGDRARSGAVAAPSAALQTFCLESEEAAWAVMLRVPRAPWWECGDPRNLQRAQRSWALRMVIARALGDSSAVAPAPAEPSTQGVKRPANWHFVAHMYGIAELAYTVPAFDVDKWRANLREAVCGTSWEQYSEYAARAALTDNFLKLNAGQSVGRNLERIYSRAGDYLGRSVTSGHYPYYQALSPAEKAWVIQYVMLQLIGDAPEVPALPKPDLSDLVVDLDYGELERKLEAAAGDVTYGLIVKPIISASPINVEFECGIDWAQASITNQTTGPTEFHIQPKSLFMDITKYQTKAIANITLVYGQDVSALDEPKTIQLIRQYKAEASALDDLAESSQRIKQKQQLLLDAVQILTAHLDTFADE